MECCDVCGTEGTRMTIVLSAYDSWLYCYGESTDIFRIEKMVCDALVWHNITEPVAVVMADGLAVAFYVAHGTEVL